MVEKQLKQWLMNRAKYSKNRDGAGKIRKPQTYLWTCSAVPEVCPQKKHPRIMCAVHGSYEDAMNCNRRAIAAGLLTAL